MHTGGIALLEGPAPPYPEVLEHVRSRLHLVPRYRRRLAVPPLGLGEPRWVDEPAFNLAYHVRHTGLPAPGDGAKLNALAARVFSQQLDRSKPLWELWIVEHLEGGGWALVSKAGLELVEGDGDVDLMATLFDTDPETRPAAAPHWEPGPAPTPAQLAAIAVNEALSPRSALERARRALDAAGERARAAAAGPPDSPLNVRTGPHRRLAVVDLRLDDFRTVKDAFGGTVNDVVLAVVAGALRRWLHERATRTEGLDVRAGVPVSTEGGRLVQVECPLPVDVPDPIERLRAISAHMAEVTRTQRAQGAQVIAAAGDFAPPTILARAARLAPAGRSAGLLVTNVPGPQTSLYVLGRRLERTFPIPALVAGHALAVAIMSYDGSMDFGLLADYDAVPDLPVFATSVEATLDELLGLASAPLARRTPKTTRTRARARARREAARRRS
ncbi:MAG TPA: wax ester/triacylglycerol synthase family O-acyltransferase [Solirubrobacteraceae bacterium]